MCTEHHVNVSSSDCGGNCKWKCNLEEPSPSRQVPPKLHIATKPGGTLSADNHATETLSMVVMDGSGNGKVDRDIGSNLKQTRLPDWAKIAWIW